MQSFFVGFSIQGKEDQGEGETLSFAGSVKCFTAVA